jgi:hypothetical protein
MDIAYLHLLPGSAPPPLGDAGPFMAVLVLDQATPDEWRDRVSAGLVEAGCLFLMAWGVDCEVWHDAVDDAVIAAAGDDEIPDDRFVLTTWHSDETLSETFWFAGYGAWHPTLTLDRLLIIDIGPVAREAVMLDDYRSAQDVVE